VIPLAGYVPLDPRGRVITDPAAAIAVRQGVALNQEQADALRRRVAEVRASLQRWADRWDLSVAAVARIRLAEIAAARGRKPPFTRFTDTQLPETTRLTVGDWTTAR
jgi:hypothetical protein